ncbi:hypothetical protein [Ramlibacter albus]|uniref:Uncharacterized protein n=1 Tax=Ramlibacter albus TaxID=2079448 RepID=A0A923M4A6_9BURK|nr:hypothetical protein [Ramlibacter albus]MBC5763932.1 hypothetical protein [Ramlibacter albus]
MDRITHTRQAWQARLLWPWLLGAAATLAGGWLSSALSAVHGLPGFAATLLLLLALYGVAAVLARVQAAGPTAAIAGVFYLGIPVGLVIDAMLERTSGGAPRELFPYELAIWCAYAALPVAVGMAIGSWWHSRHPT